MDFRVTPGETYKFECAARGTSGAYSSLTINIMDRDYNVIAKDEVGIGPEIAAPGTPTTGDVFLRHTAELTAPELTRYGSVVLYSEGTVSDTVSFRECELVSI